MKITSSHSKLVFLSTVFGVLVISVFFVMNRLNPRVDQYFDIQVESDWEVVEEFNDIALFDGQVGWLINTNSSIAKPPKGYTELPFSTDYSSKYTEVVYGFSQMFPRVSFENTRLKVFIGGPQGNSFVGISESRGIMVLSRFWS
ncbi:MAG: hypothetical protein ABW104_20885 [Candidatus Thiodiazotropha sp. 6PLUC2]